ncbi:N-acetyltransferase eso1 [Grifola frondosa]|uniref:N-acetyltransferase eso1 n=1 Tax=Grifola frondosa TaxID=5627 RepID=A0A1C7M777_GRIFR|nr:N-acetyltransferase eso1 [Grifola frondosa]
MLSDSPARPTSVWKGKARASEVDFEDLNLVITYRHLLSHNLGVRDPLRVVALCDSDAFYAACEQVHLGIDPSRPLVVLQWDSLIAVNYPARKFGISRMDKVKDALKRCPELVVIHVATYKEGEKEPGYWEKPDTQTHKVSLDHYRRESMKIIQLFKDGLPNGEIEKASIDEAFIDFTRPIRETILERYPYLAQVPPDAPNGADSPLPPPPPISWDGLGNIIPVHPPAPTENSAVHPAMSDGVEGDDSLTTWHDVALSIAAELMAKIREDVRVKLGYTTSAGIARNKFLAKLTASYKKPMSQSILRNTAIPNYLKPMPFQKIRFLGGKLGKAFAEEYDVSTVGADFIVMGFRTISLDEMQRKFGEDSIWVYEILRGIDRSEVKEKSVVNKKLALRLNEAREANPAQWPKTIALHTRQGLCVKEYDTFRSKQTGFPFTKNITVDVIASYGDRLWKELVGTEESRATPMKITNVQLSFAGIETMETGQRSIEGFLKTRSSSEAPQQSDAAGKRKRSEPVEATPTDISDNASFVCPRCCKSVALSDVWTDGGISDEIRSDALAALRMEHADFHFAQDLAKESSDNDAPKRIIRPIDKTTSKKRRKQTADDSEAEGIAKFFNRK